VYIRLLYFSCVEILTRGHRSWKCDWYSREADRTREARMQAREDTTVQHISLDNLQLKAVNFYIHSFTAVSNCQGFSLWCSSQTSSNIL